MGFTASRRVHLSAFGDSAIWAVAMIGASAPLRLGALSRSRSKLLVIFRDPEHYLPTESAVEERVVQVSAQAMTRLDLVQTSAAP